MIRFIGVQTKIILEKRITIAIYFGLLGCVLYHFVKNVLMYRGQDTLQMLHPMNNCGSNGQSVILSTF